MKKVSVIVPVYNSHDTLARCLTSLVNQTLEDIEIIVINDASTDDSWDIMLSFESRYPEKLIIINGDVNRGSGGARNQGFDIASGEYIGLVDSDDYVASNMFELLYNKAKETDADIVDCGFYSESTGKAIVFTSDDLTGTLDGKKRSKLITSGGYLVSKIFRNKLWNSPQIRMREHVRCLEDMEILIYMFLRADSISNVKAVLYNYCDTSGSATKTIDLQAYYNSIYGAMKAIHEACSPLLSYKDSKYAIEYAITNIYSYGINCCIRDRITQLGAKEDNVPKYFEELDDNVKKLLSNLASLKKRVVITNYRDNPETTSRIDNLDILIMEESDRRWA